MRPKSLNCPNCSAPLRLADRQNRVLCVYCGSTIVLETGAPEARASFELPPDVLDQLKQMLLDGRKLEAIHLYQQRAGVTEAEALETLNNLIGDLTRRTVVQQPMSNAGMLFYVSVDAALTLFVVWAYLNENWLAFGVALALMLLHSLAFAAGVLARVRYELGAPAPARVHKFARVGEIRLRGQPEPVQIVRLWLEVRPPNQPAFQAEKNVAIRKPSFDQLQPGVVIEVRHNHSGYVFPTLPMKVLGLPVDA
jgi:ribosomal protein S27AE